MSKFQFQFDKSPSSKTWSIIKTSLSFFQSSSKISFFFLESLIKRYIKRTSYYNEWKSYSEWEGGEVERVVDFDADAMRRLATVVWIAIGVAAPTYFEATPLRTVARDPMSIRGRSVCVRPAHTPSSCSWSVGRHVFPSQKSNVSPRKNILLLIPSLSRYSCSRHGASWWIEFKEMIFRCWMKLVREKVDFDSKVEGVWLIGFF